MYREHRCGEHLERFVECYWTRDDADGAETRVLPDGCADILFPEGERPFVVGTMTRPLVVDRGDGSPIVAVRFRAGGAYPFFSVPLGELTDERVELRDVWRGAEPVETVAELEAELTRRLPSVPEPEPRVAEAVRRIQDAKGRLRVGRLSAELGLSRQHLNRLFERHVGVGVKLFSRVTRLSAVLERLGSVGSDWAGLAVDAGYYDQSHLSAEIRELTGLTPTELMSERA